MKRQMYGISIAIFLMLAVPAKAQDALVFGIVPQQSAKKLAKLWTPISQYLSEKSGVQIRFATANNIPTFEQRMLNGEYDMAYMNPYHFTFFNLQPGYEAIAKQKNKLIKGIMVVKKDSSVTSLGELDGQQIAFPSPAAFAASVLPRAKMKQDGIQFTPKYVSSHDSVYLTVDRGLLAAGGGILRTLNNTNVNVRDNLRVLWTTPGYTPHAFAVHPRVDADVKEKLRLALVGMSTDPKGQELLKSINFKGIESAEDDDWDDVRSLGIDLLDHMLK